MFFVFQALDFRREHNSEPFAMMYTIFNVEEKKSVIEGNGLYTKASAVKGSVVHAVVLPSIRTEGITYDCNKHIMHNDKQGMVLIDPGHLFRGNIQACLEDMRSRMVCLLNHSKLPNVQLCLDEVSPPDWYEPVGDHKVETWYSCSIVTLRDVEEGEELTIEYVEVPDAWN